MVSSKLWVQGTLLPCHCICTLESKLKSLNFCLESQKFFNPGFSNKFLASFPSYYLTMKVYFEFFLVLLGSRATVMNFAVFSLD